MLNLLKSWQFQVADIIVLISSQFGGVFDLFFLARGADVNTSKRNSDTSKWRFRRGHEFASLAFWGILVSDTSNDFAEKFEAPVDSLEMLRDGFEVTT